MKLLPITLGIAHKGSASFFQTMSPEALADLKNKIFDRDRHMCQCCGFVSEKYQQLHIIDGSAKPNENNLATTCIFCQQTFDLESVSKMRSGVLIWLPEIEQAALHHIARALYVARISQGPMSVTARKILDTLMTRREDVRSRLGSDDPYVLSSVLRDYIGRRQYADRKRKLEGVRLFPLDRRIIKEEDLEFNQFPQILAYWRSKAGPFADKTPNSWIDMYREKFPESA